MVVVAALMFVPPLSAEAEDRTEKEIAAAKAFNIEGVKLGMSKEEFLQLFPEAVEDSKRSRPDIGVEALRVDNTGKTSGIDVKLLDGKVIEVYAFYTDSRVEEMGGVGTLAERLVLKFGKAEANSPGRTEGGKLALIWRIHGAAFWCKLSKAPDITAINYVGVKGYALMLDRKRKIADPGF